MTDQEKKPQNPPAFACIDNMSFHQPGMNLRDYFANSAMQGICVNAGRNRFDLYNEKEIVIKAYELADAMLKQREL